METDHQEEKIRAQFNCYIKKCLRNETRNVLKAQKHIADHEILFSELPEANVENFYIVPEQGTFLHTFQALNYPVTVENDRLSEALRLLSEEKRTIILLHYYLDMSDLEISRLTHTQQTQVKKTRQRTLFDLRKKMEDTHDEA